MREFRAQTIRVETPWLLMVDLDLDFGVRHHKGVQIIGVPEIRGDDALRKARHCLVVLAGSRSLVVRPDMRMREKWGAISPLPSRVFVADRVHGEPVGYVETLPEAQGPALEIGPYMAWLARGGFNVETVKGHLSRPRAAKRA